MRALVLCLALAAGLSQAAIAPAPEPDMLHLKVYYESLCPDSIRFMKEQLLPTWTELKDIIDVDIVAYGKAEDDPTPSGGYNFTCQHGSEECRGNTMLACARDHISSHDDYIDFSLCVMTADYPPDAGHECASKQEAVNWVSIAACTISQEGERALHALGEMQREEVPDLYYIPWMIVNGEQNEDIRAEAEYNLFILTCNEYGGEKPEECNL